MTLGPGLFLTFCLTLTFACATLCRFICRFFVVANDALQGAYLEYWTLHAADGNCYGAQGHLFLLYSAGINITIMIKSTLSQFSEINRY